MAARPAQKVTLRFTALLVAASAAQVLGMAAAVPTSSPPKEPSILRVTPAFKNVSKPKRILTDAAGNVYVLSAGDHSIIVFDPELQPIRRIARVGNAAGELYEPADMSMFQDTIWVADFRNNRVQQFATSGAYLRHFETPFPISVAALAADRVAVVGRRDDALFRVFDSGGSLIRRTDGLIDRGGRQDWQNAYFNRGRVFRGLQGEVLFMFSSLLQPLLRWYDAAGAEIVDELIVAAPPDAASASAAFREMIVEARRTRQESIASDRAGVRGTLNGIGLDATTGDVWVAPATSVLYRYRPNQRTPDEYELKDDEGRLYGVHDIAVDRLNRRLLMISSTRCVVAALP